MAKKKVDADVVRIGDTVELDKYLGEYSGLVAQVDKVTAAYNEEEQARREVLSAQVAEPKARIAQLERSFLMWAENNRHEFGDKKSIDLTHGLIAFRKSPPSVKALKGFTLASSLELVKRAKNLVDRFVRKKEELDREAILQAYARWESDAKCKDGISDSALEKFGLEIKQEENFYVEAKMAVEGGQNG